MRNLLFISFLFLFACNDDSSLRQKELELKGKELQLKEKELEMAAKADKIDSPKMKESKPHPEEKKKKKKLRYLYYDNGGLIGYFDDGSIGGCARCDLINENVRQSDDWEITGTYRIEGGCLITRNQEKDCPNAEAENDSGFSGWAMIDYEWLMDLD